MAAPRPAASRTAAVARTPLVYRLRPQYATMEFYFHAIRMRARAYIAGMHTYSIHIALHNYSDSFANGIYSLVFRVTFNFFFVFRYLAQPAFTSRDIPSMAI